GLRGCVGRVRLGRGRRRLVGGGVVLGLGRGLGRVLAHGARRVGGGVWRRRVRCAGGVGPGGLGGVVAGRLGRVGIRRGLRRGRLGPVAVVGAVLRRGAVPLGGERLGLVGDQVARGAGGRRLGGGLGEDPHALGLGGGLHHGERRRREPLEALVASTA